MSQGERALPRQPFRFILRRKREVCRKDGDGEMGSAWMNLVIAFCVSRDKIVSRDLCLCSYAIR